MRSPELNSGRLIRKMTTSGFYAALCAIMTFPISARKLKAGDNQVGCGAARMSACKPSLDSASQRSQFNLVPRVSRGFEYVL